MKVRLLLVLLLVAGCTSVSELERRYQAGDHGQLAKIMEIAGRGDYPYGTRRKATQALGEIRDPAAVPVLAGMLMEYDARTTLKQDAVVALGRIGDTTAVAAIGRMLDYHVEEGDEELRQVSVAVLGELGGGQAAGILINALRYYDQAMLYRDQQVLRGTFSGEEQPDPYAPVSAAQRDSAAHRPPRMGGMLPEERGQMIDMFGMPAQPSKPREDLVPREREGAHRALVRVGAPAVPVIERHLESKQTTPSLRHELTQVLDEIRQAQATAPADSATVPAPARRN